MDPEKKISFGFNKLSKKPASIYKPKEKKVDYVVCLEGQSIKLKDESKKEEKTSLVIPLNDNKKNLLDRIKNVKSKIIKREKEEIEDTRPDSELTIEELAARELMREAKLKLSGSGTKDNKIFVVPIKKDDELILEGERESTLNDYENVPIGDFGLAMIRGMGWKEGMIIGKNPTKMPVSKPPELRPKGLGLGASIVINPETQTQPVDTDGQFLILKRGSCAKIIAGNYKGSYCEVQGLDDESGRIIVKTSLKGDILPLSEFMLIPVTKEEYSKGSKIINIAKYDEYKEMEERKARNEKNYKHSISPSEKSKIEKTEKYSNNEYYGHSRSLKKDIDKSALYSKNNDSSDSNNDERTKRTYKRKDKRRHRDKSRSPYRTKHKSSKKSSKSKHRYGSSSDSEYEKCSNNKCCESDDSMRKNKM